MVSLRRDSFAPGDAKDVTRWRSRSGECCDDRVHVNLWENSQGLDAPLRDLQPSTR